MCFRVEYLSLLHKYIFTDFDMFIESSLIELPTTLRTLFQIATILIVLFLFLRTISLVLKHLPLLLFVLHSCWNLVIHTICFYWLKHLSEILILLLWYLFLVLSRLASCLFLPIVLCLILSLILMILLILLILLILQRFLSGISVLLLRLDLLLKQIEVSSGCLDILFSVISDVDFDLLHVGFPWRQCVDLFFMNPSANLYLLTSLL